MGQKVNPHGLRVGIIKNWDSRWFARDDVFGDTLVEDYQLRKFLKKKFYDAGVPNIEIERDAARVRIHIHCARPGVVIGKGGVEIEKTRKACEEIINKNREQKLAVYLNVVEVRQIDKNAQLVAENIAQQLENRVSFRRAMKQAIGRAMRFGARGIKVQVSGRLGGAEIARTEHYHEGTIPLQTLRADIDYGFAEAATTYGRIGVKVWIYEGEVLGEVRSERPRNPRQPRRDNRDRRDARPPRSDNRPPRSDNRSPRAEGRRPQ
ncbi:MAG: 30S ribosomal protein S3 [Oscillospiraceae bacterium]|jgi:small subunit ribosomal protein S3